MTELEKLLQEVGAAPGVEAMPETSELDRLLEETGAVEAPGFFGGVATSAERGFKSAQQSFTGLQAQNAAQRKRAMESELARAQEREAAQVAAQTGGFDVPRRFGGPAVLPDPARERVEAEIRRLRDGALEQRDKLRDKAELVARLEKEIQSLPQSEGFQRWREAEGGKASALAFLANPIEVTANILAESAAASIPSMVGGAVGGTVTGGPAGTAVGVAGGSFLTEYSASILDSLREQGVDLSDPEAFMAALGEPEQVREAREKAVKRGVPVAAFDALTAGLAGRFLKGAGKGVAAKAKAGGKEAGVQAAGGASGEAGAQVVSGEELDFKAIFEEAIGELAPGTAEVLVNALNARRGQARESELDLSSKNKEKGKGDDLPKLDKGGRKAVEELDKAQGNLLRAERREERARQDFDPVDTRSRRDYDAAAADREAAVEQLAQARKTAAGYLSAEQLEARETRAREQAERDRAIAEEAAARMAELVGKEEETVDRVLADLPDNEARETLRRARLRAAEAKRLPSQLAPDSVREKEQVRLELRRKWEGLKTEEIPAKDLRRLADLGDLSAYRALDKVETEKVAKWGEEKLRVEAEKGNVRARRVLARRNLAEAGKQRASKVIEEESIRNLKSYSPEELTLEELQFLAERGDERAQDEVIRREEEGELDRDFRDPKEELQRVLKEMGGLPHPDTILENEGSPQYVGELRHILESTTTERKTKRKDGSPGVRKVRPVGLWTKKYKSLDNLQLALRERGFTQVTDINSLFDLLERRFVQGEEVFPEYGADEHAGLYKGGQGPKFAREGSATPEEIEGFRKKLRGLEPVVLTGREVPEGPAAVMRERARQLAQPFLGKSFVNEETGKAVTITAKKLNHVLSNKGFVHFRMIPALPRLIRGARFLRTEAARRQERNVVEVDKFGHRLKIGEQTYEVLLTAKVYNDGRRLYDAVAWKEKNPSGNSPRVTAEEQSLASADRGVEVNDWPKADGSQAALTPKRKSPSSDSPSASAQRQPVGMADRGTGENIRPVSPPSQGQMDGTAVAAAIKPVLDGWSGAPLVEVAESLDTLAAQGEGMGEYVDWLRAQGAEGREAGWYDPNLDAVVLLSGNLRDAEHARRILAHETIGHRGLRELLGGELNSFLQAVFEKYRGTDTMAEIKRLYRIDETSEAGRLEAAEEIVARLAEGDLSEPGLWQRIVVAARRWLARRGFGEAFGEEDIRSLLRRARRRTEDGPLFPRAGTPTAFARATYDDLQGKAKRLQERLEMWEKAIAEAGEGKLPADLLGQRAVLRVELDDVMLQMASLRPEAHPGYLQPREQGEAPRFSRLPAEVQQKAREVEAGTLDRSLGAEEFGRGVKKFFNQFVSSTPEVPSVGGQGRFFAGFQQGYRRLKAADRAVKREAEKSVDGVLEPIKELGRKVHDPSSTQAYFDVGRALARLRRVEREMEHKGWPDEQTLARHVKKVAARQAKLKELEAKLSGNPFHLFRQAVLYRDLWYRTFLTNRKGEPLRLPGDLSAEEVRARLAEIHEEIDGNEHKAAIEESLKRHYKLVSGLQKDLVERGHVITEEMRNPLYYPHHILDLFDGRVERVRVTTEEDFRKYLVDPVGSARGIEADYLGAMYAHVAAVKSHNARQDAVERYWKPYDISGEIKKQVEEAAAEEGRPPHSEEWHQPWNIPPGYGTYNAAKKLPLRMDYVLDRETLAKELGVAFNDGDLVERMKDLGVDLDVKPEHLRQALRVDDNDKLWVLPEEMIEALEGIDRRERAVRARPEGVAAVPGKVIRGLMKGFKMNVLFAPWNWLRFEFNNVASDVPKAWAIDPAMFGKMNRARKEVFEFFKNKKVESPELREAFQRGVLDTIVAGEVGDIRKLERFSEFLGSGKLTINEMKKWGTTTTELSRYREAVFRYSKFLTDVERMRAGASPVYGGAYWRDVEAREDLYDKAAFVAQRAFGDYDDLSVAGEWMRQHLFPFWAWTETNTKHHVNLARNMVDMVRSSRWTSAGQTARHWGGLATAQAVGLLTRLAVPYLALQAWNHFGGAMVGLWDEDEDLEGQLSEHDRRRAHILLGRDSDGKIRVVYAPLAIADVMEWFAEENLVRLVMEVAKGDIDLEQALGDYAKEAPKDVANKLVQSVRPDVKAVYIAGSRRNPFPDVFDQRAVSDHDLGWVIFGSMTDRTVSMAMRSMLDKDYLAPQDIGEWAQQTVLQIRRRDPEQWSFYEMKGLADEYVEARTGRTFSLDYNAPDQQVLRNWRRAVYRGDVRAAMRFYNRLLALGYTADRLKGSIRAQDPLAGLPKAMREEFVAQLSGRERKSLQRAYRYYTKIANLKGAEEDLFPRKGREAFFVPDYDAMFEELREQQRPEYLIDRDAQRLLRESLD